MIPKKTKSENKVVKGLTAQRFIGLFMVIIVSSMIGTLLGGVLQWLFIAFSLIVYFILTGRSPTNPFKNFARGLAAYITFKFDNKEFLGTTNKDYIEYMARKEQKNENKSKKQKAKKEKY